MKDNKDIKLKIFETALEIYCENPVKFSVRTVAKELKLKREDVYTHFSSKNAILRYYYQLCFEEYIKQTNKIDGYSKFSLEEKLGHLVYTHIELFQKEKEFVVFFLSMILFQPIVIFLKYLFCKITLPSLKKFQKIQLMEVA